MEEIKKSSKPCPKCGTAIFKTEGCDQMFCIVCHTAFSWTTLKIETGRIHNPHYYEILRKNGEIRREEGDIRPCDEDVQYNHVVIEQIQQCVGRAEINKTIHLFRFIDEIRQYWNEQQYIIDNTTFSDIRKRYLQKHISEDEYKRCMKRKNTIMTKKKEISEVLTVFKITCSEELKRLMRDDNGNFITSLTPGIYIRKKYQQFTENLFNIVSNTNKILKDIGKKYTSYYIIEYDIGGQNNQIANWKIRTSK